MQETVAAWTRGVEGMRSLLWEDLPGRMPDTVLGLSAEDGFILGSDGFPWKGRTLGIKQIIR